MDDTAPLPSERKFGLFFAGVFAALAAWQWYVGHLPLAAASFAVALALGVVALLAPRFLALPNRLWYRLGMLLGVIVSPIVLGAMFVVLFVPTALAMRAAGRDALKRRFEAEADTYWVDRHPPGPPPDSFKQQF